ncbi:hypothetical protein [Sphingomonas prati]|uniref:Uncharacterized protein n=1 Tax=Sphingomonas prati TaxID=1843237 RepID=A0A7W9F2X7_9SPHN|nr:hypothetical protein [Sphingomonas prati]MBB5728930.1 hypothetical protein [Sphingomonas prati]
MQRFVKASRDNWFYAILPVLFAAALNFRATHPWDDQPQFGEAVTLFDWCIFVPFIYVACYRNMPRRALAIRALAIACGGIWIAGKIVPDPAETILTQWSWLRGVGIAVLVLAESAALIAVLRIAFGSAPDATELERQGMPPLLARMILAEARLWRWVWDRLRGK